MNGITKEEAIEICRQESITSIQKLLKSVQEWQPSDVTDKQPIGTYVTTESPDEGVWFMSPPYWPYYPPLQVGGGAPIMGISKKTGRIVFSGTVGE